MSDEISALIVPVPAADPVVGPFRATLDSGAAIGVPAHITVLFPFMPADLLDADVIGQLERVFAAVEAFPISFTDVGWFDHDVVYLEPDPDTVLREMTGLVVRRWPQWPPYGGAHGDPTPHLTIGDNGDLPAMRRAAGAIRQRLPLHADVTEVHLYIGSAEPGSWHHCETFPLGGVPAP